MNSTINLYSRIKSIDPMDEMSTSNDARPSSVTNERENVFRTNRPTKTHFCFVLLGRSAVVSRDKSDTFHLQFQHSVYPIYCKRTTIIIIVATVNRGQRVGTCY